MDWTSDLKIDTSVVQGRVPVHVFRVEGRINLSNAQTLEKKAQEAHQQGMRNLLLDLTAVPSLTSAGLRSIMAVYKMMRNKQEQARETAAPAQKSPHFKLLNTSSDNLRVFKLAGFDAYLDIYDNMEEAIAAF